MATESLPPLPPRSTRANAPSHFSFAPASVPAPNLPFDASTPAMSPGVPSAIDPPIAGGLANAPSPSASSAALSNLSPRHRPAPPPRPAIRSPSSRPATPPIDANQQTSPALSPSAARTPTARARVPPPLRLPPSCATGAPAAPSAPIAPPVPPLRRTSACAVTTAPLAPSVGVTATSAVPNPAINPAAPPHPPALAPSRRASAPVVISTAIAAPPPLSIPVAATTPVAGSLASVPPTLTLPAPAAPPSRRASAVATGAAPSAASLSPSSVCESVRIHTQEDKTYDLKSPRYADAKQCRVTPSSDIFREPDNLSGMLKMARHGPYHYLPMKTRWCIFSPRVQCLWYWANRKRGSKSHCLLIKGFKLDGASTRQFYLELEFDRLVLVETDTDQERERWIQSLGHAFDVGLHVDQKLSDDDVRERITTLERIRTAFFSEFNKSQIHVPKTGVRKRSDAALPCL